MPRSLPALASLLTGRWPRNTGLLGSGDDLGEPMETLATALASQGYGCAWFVPESWARLPLLGQGFEHAGADGDLQAALDWLRRGDSAPRFALVHVGANLTDPDLVDRIEAWVAGAPGGRLAAVAGLAGPVSMDDPLRDRSVRVPLAILGSGAEPGRRERFAASLHDLPRTLASAVGAPWTSRDRSADLLSPDLARHQRLLVLETFFPDVPADRQAVVVEGLVLHRPAAPPAQPDWPRMFVDPARSSLAPRDLAPGAPGQADTIERLFAVWRNGQRRLEHWRAH
ncbi:hypothetical protein [Engelhardtia mirabilis]|uniref:Uncharacterized protein n=1 Tax=Engelhardtia mirabilis TaxID=2528011 RepID=A0A518BKW6_9BACT|nr:hypothetical protein Pla133_27030 [Planctomycetes bacterium Pla133]QDV01941.1 hypothetical protein Pla86_27020 [Planctomycetes bacterium Pla86]